MRRKVEMFWLRLFSSTTVSGQMTRINSFFATSFSLMAHQVKERVEGFRGKGYRDAVAQEQALDRLQPEAAEFVDGWLFSAHGDGRELQMFSEVFRVILKTFPGHGKSIAEPGPVGRSRHVQNP